MSVRYAAFFGRWQPFHNGHLHIVKKVLDAGGCVWVGVRDTPLSERDPLTAQQRVEMLRVLKPGGHLLAFGGTRTYHRMACAIEDAGFEIRDQIQWLYGSGFPKSLDVSKAIDKAAGVKFRARPAEGVGFMNPEGSGGYNVTKNRLVRTEESTEAAKQWEGFGTALKPANEPICLARKPLSEKTVAANVLRWGTGALNIDGCRIGASRDDDIHGKNPHTRGGFGHADAKVYDENRGGAPQYDPTQGRWPANVIHDGSEEVVGMFPNTKAGVAIGRNASAGRVYGGGKGLISGEKGDDTLGYADSGSAARFFYCAKASRAERGEGNKHPTVKPIKLMRYLCRLVTPPGGIVLDPFVGSGTTCIAARQEGYQYVGIEKDVEYAAKARRRVAAAPRRSVCASGKMGKGRKVKKGRKKQ